MNEQTGQLIAMTISSPQLHMPKTIDKKTVHKYESIGSNDLLILFGGPLTKVQGPSVCSPPPRQKKASVRSAVTAIKPVSNPFYLPCGIQGKIPLSEYSHLHSVALVS